MIWLLSQMWVALAGAAVFGLLFGWAFRGLLLNGKTRRAVGERDIAQTELAHAKSEIEELYAAQRRAGDGGAVADDATLRQELDLREAKLKSLTDELTKSKSELASLKTAGATGAAIAAGGAAVLAAQESGETVEAAPAAAAPTAETVVLDDASLEWRNRYLRSRVRKLETDLDMARASAAQAPAETESELVDIAVPVDAAPSEAAPATDTVAMDKLKWQNDYLRQRLGFLERQAELTPTVTATAAPLPLADAPPADVISDIDDAADTAETDEPDIEALVSAADDAGESPEQEMARLRWRNRYLESRIAYYEGGEDGATDEDGAPDDGETDRDIGAAALTGAAAITAGVAALVGDNEAEAEGDVEQRDDAFEIDEEPADETDLDTVPDAEPEAQIETEPETSADPAAGYWDRVPEAEAIVEDADEAVDLEVSEETQDDVEATADHDDVTEVSADLHDETSDETDAEEIETAELSEEASTDTTYEETLDEEPSSEEIVSDDTADEDTQSVEAASDEAALEDVSAETVTLQPAALDAPIGDEADDLTAIGGIGPKIADVLGDLGIYHYDQIAAWTPENAAWIDEHLNFDGRVDREKWIDQAKVLSDI